MDFSKVHCMEEDQLLAQYMGYEIIILYNIIWLIFWGY